MFTALDLVGFLMGIAGCLVSGVALARERRKVSMVSDSVHHVHLV